jgi:hypothetical protein
MHAKETTHDWSEVDGCRGWETLYTAPSDRRLIRLLSGIPGPWSYRDSGHEDDTIEYPQGMIVRKFVAVGDTVGEEAGSRTSVRAEFQDFQVELESVPVAIRDPSRSPLLCRAGMIFRASEALRKIGDL